MASKCALVAKSVPIEREYDILTIISISQARLAARIGSYLNAKRLAEVVGTDLKIYWPKSDWEVDNAAEIFSQNFIDRLFINSYDELATVEYDDKAAEKMSGEQLRGYLSSGDISVLTTRPFVIPGQDFKSSATAATAAFEMQDFSEPFQSVMRIVNEKMNGATYVGVHVRRGDILDDWAQAHLQTRYQPLPIVVRAMAKYMEKEPTVQFVIASDDDGVRRSLLRRFGNAVEAPSLAKDVVVTDLQGALRDMMILSKCEVVLAPAFSGFSTIAAMMGGHERIDASLLLTEGERRDAMLVHFGERSTVALGHLDAIDYGIFAKMELKAGKWESAKRAIAKALTVSPNFTLLHLIKLEVSTKIKNKIGVSESLAEIAKAFPKLHLSMQRLVVRTLLHTMPAFMDWQRSISISDAAEIALAVWKIHDLAPKKVIAAAKAELRERFYSAMVVRPQIDSGTKL